MSTEYLFPALKAKVGNAQRKLILITLADIANEKGKCWPSHSYLSDRAECSRRSVINHLAQLEESGFISIENRSEKGIKTSNIYTIHDVQNLHIDVQDLHGGSAAVAQGGSAAAAHNTTTIKTPIDPPKYKGFDLTGPDVGGFSIDTVKEFIDHRVKLKKPLPSQNSLNRFLKRAWDIGKELNLPINDVVEMTIDAGWQSCESSWIQSRMIDRTQGAMVPATAAQSTTGKTRDRSIQDDLTDTSWAN